MESKIIDINILSIFLVEDHPAHAYVKDTMFSGLKGVFKPILLDILPIRAHWLMTARWNIDRNESIRAVRSFLRYNQPVYVGMTKSSIEYAFQLSEELKHDVYDCCYLALAAQEGASGIVTTDSDFESLCRRKNLRYENPVPNKILRKFKG
ncbi:MAG: type II toxin-antitoxin system VapC family toxin [Nitrososphaerales archaeon]